MQAGKMLASPSCILLLILLAGVLFVHSKQLNNRNFKLLQSSTAAATSALPLFLQSQRGGAKAKKAAAPIVPKKISLFQKLVDFFKGLINGSNKIYKQAAAGSKSESSSSSSSGNSKAKAKPKAAAAAQQQFSASDKTLSRIQKEMKTFLEDPPDGVTLAVSPKNVRVWICTLTGPAGTVFAGEKYKLKITFPKDYPSKPVSAYFLQPSPKHMHVYSNGDICCSLLGTDWRPTMTAQLIAVSILSMLSSAKEKSMPQDNALHADSPPGQSQDKWMYHDDRC